MDNPTPATAPESLPEGSSLLEGELTPRQVVEALDKYIVGQHAAKRSVAIALRNRLRRQKLPEEIQEEVYPKNILMIGPTGVGKTEIARRLARLADAPFHKVEASKFTEVGYVGRDVESMIRDVVETAVNRKKVQRMERSVEEAELRTEERLLDLLLPTSRVARMEWENEEDEPGSLAKTREKLREKLQDGKLEERLVEVDVKSGPGVVIGGLPMGAGMEELTTDLKDMVEKMMPQNRKPKSMTVAQARPLLQQEEMEKLIDMDVVVHDAVDWVQQCGIIFIDEIDKIVGREGGQGPDVSREGVQRDILPIVEGTSVFTKYGQVRTDHILFIGAGAFHNKKPSDLIPELQGRFPIRVELDALERDDLKRILSEPRSSLMKQYQALLATEGLEVDFGEDALEEIAAVASRMNEQMENIGARRLQTVMEKLLEDISYNAPEMDQKKVNIDRQFVQDKLTGIVEDTDLSRYIL
jgi:ATP-dependent HslUV protease ATP-binding subunit HslU